METEIAATHLLEEAKEISNLFLGWKFGNTTRSGSKMELEESSIIKSDHEAMMYIFNYNDGFTLYQKNGSVSW